MIINTSTTVSLPPLLALLLGGKSFNGNGKTLQFSFKGEFPKYEDYEQTPGESQTRKKHQEK